MNVISWVIIIDYHSFHTHNHVSREIRSGSIRDISGDNAVAIVETPGGVIDPDGSPFHHHHEEEGSDGAHGTKRGGEISRDLLLW